MHHIYHTHGFVLGSRNSGEANKVITLYTRELGLIRAATQGVRLHKSKLRFALQDFSYANIDLVRGKEIWRITSATSITSFPYTRADRSSLLIMARVSSLIGRLCDGEESHEEIFDEFIQALYLLDDTNMTKESREALELHLVLRIMNTLGYIGESKMLSSYLSSSFDQVQTENLLRERASIISHINRALSESML